MNCPFCDKKNPASRNTCKNCGLELTRPLSSVPAGQRPPATVRARPTRTYHDWDKWKQVLSMVIGAILLSAISFFIKRMGDPPKAPEIDNYRLAKLVEEFNETESFPEKMDIFTRISLLNGVSTDDYIAASKGLGDAPHFQLGVLNVGLVKNGGQAAYFKEMERLSSVERIVNHQDNRDNIYEIILQKHIEDITWEDMYGIKYFFQDAAKATVTYSFSSPFDFDSPEEFEASCVTVDYRHTDRSGYRGYAALIGCEELCTNVGLMPGDILGKPYLRLTAFVYDDKITWESDTGLTALERFSAAPWLEEVNIRGEYFRCGDLRQLENLRKATLQNWMPVGPDNPPKTEFPLNDLASAPSLEEVTLVNFTVTANARNTLSGPDIRSLALIECSLADLAGIEALAGLQHLFIESCSAQSLDFVAAFPQLESLQIYNSAAPFQSSEASIRSLKVLAIGRAIPIDPFLECRDLEFLAISNADALSALNAFPNLRWLELTGEGQTYDLNQLPDLPNLESLTIAPANQILHPEALDSFPSLTEFQKGNAA